jgi:hypothetical protein
MPDKRLVRSNPMGSKSHLAEVGCGRGHLAFALMLVRGAVRILIPETIMGYAAKVVGNKQFYLVSGIVLVVLALVLCHCGYVV